MHNKHKPTNVIVSNNSIMNYELKVDKSGMGPLLLLEWIADMEWIALNGDISFHLENDVENNQIILTTRKMNAMVECEKYISLNS